jgi:hypothetical protein
MDTRIAPHCSQQLTGKNAFLDLLGTHETPVHFLRYYYPRFWTSAEQAADAPDAPDGRMCGLCFQSYIIDDKFRLDTPYFDYPLSLPEELSEVMYFEECDRPPP